jgi:hypothetical protein
VGALRVESGHRGLTLKDGVEVAFRWRGNVALPWTLMEPNCLNAWTKHFSVMSHGTPAKEDLGAVWAGAQAGGIAVEHGGPLQGGGVRWVGGEQGVDMLPTRQR